MNEIGSFEFQLSVFERMGVTSIEIVDNDNIVVYKGDSAEKAKKAVAKDMPRAVECWVKCEKMMIGFKHRFRSSFTIEQAVSWLFENKGITITPAQVWGLRKDLRMENIPYADWKVIHKNRQVLSSLATEQAVSWLFENKGITVNAEQLRGLMIDTIDNDDRKTQVDFDGASARALPE